MDIKKRIPKMPKISQFTKEIDTLNRIEISKSAILNNLEVYKQANPGQAILPVLKSNAYGHGLKQIAEILNGQNLEYLCVDSYYEYTKIKDIYKGNVLIIGYTKPKNYKLFDFKNLAITVYDLESIKVLDSLGKNIKIHLKIDTGMNRQGVRIEELNDILDKIAACKNLQLDGVLTHLADADNPIDQSYTDYQINIFKAALDQIKLKGLKPKYIHLSNSAAGIKLNYPEFNALRIGLGLYGYNPLSSNDQNYYLGKNLKPALQFITTVIQVKNIEKGANISYNLTYQAEENKRIGILPVGYYDGLDRRLSNIGFLTYQNHNLRILGRVCMNLTIIDLSNTPVEQNNEITVINNNPDAINSIANLAKLSETIPYVILSKLSESTRRIIVE